jgi:hypothetical protein
MICFGTFYIGLIIILRFCVGLKEVEASYSQNIKRISCRGVQFEELTLSTIPRRDRDSLFEPLVEEYRLVPYLDLDSADFPCDFSAALKIVVDIMIENTSSKVIRISESTGSPKASLVDQVVTMVNSSPMRKVIGYMYMRIPVIYSLKLCLL